MKELMKCLLVGQMLEERAHLPVHNSANMILQTVANTPVTIIRGETGCGKTTQV